MGTKHPLGTKLGWRTVARAVGAGCAGAAVLAVVPLHSAPTGADETLYLGGEQEGTTRGGCANCTWAYFEESLPFNAGGLFGDSSFSDINGFAQGGYDGSVEPSSMRLIFTNTFNGVTPSVSTGGVGIAPSSNELEFDSQSVVKTTSITVSWQDWSSAAWAYTSVNAVDTVTVEFDGNSLQGALSACDSMTDSWDDANDWTNQAGAC
jgi:hypothetical protein